MGNKCMSRATPSKVTPSGNSVSEDKDKKMRPIELLRLHASDENQNSVNNQARRFNRREILKGHFAEKQDHQGDNELHVPFMSQRKPTLSPQAGMYQQFQQKRQSNPSFPSLFKIAHLGRQVRKSYSLSKTAQVEHQIKNNDHGNELGSPNFRMTSLPNSQLQNELELALKNIQSDIQSSSQNQSSSKNIEMFRQMSSIHNIPHQKGKYSQTGIKFAPKKEQVDSKGSFGSKGSPSESQIDSDQTKNEIRLRQLKLNKLNIEASDFSSCYSSISNLTHVAKKVSNTNLVDLDQLLLGKSGAQSGISGQEDFDHLLVPEQRKSIRSTSTNNKLNAFHTMGDSSFNILIHSSTPQFNENPFQTRTGRSSTVEEEIFSQRNSPVRQPQPPPQGQFHFNPMTAAHLVQNPQQQHINGLQSIFNYQKPIIEEEEINETSARNSFKSTFLRKLTAKKQSVKERFNKKVSSSSNNIKSDQSIVTSDSEDLSQLPGQLFAIQEHQYDPHKSISTFKPSPGSNRHSPILRKKYNQKAVSREHEINLENEVEIERLISSILNPKESSQPRSTQVLTKQGGSQSQIVVIENNTNFSSVKNNIFITQSLSNPQNASKVVIQQEVMTGTHLNDTHNPRGPVPKSDIEKSFSPNQKLGQSQLEKNIEQTPQRNQNRSQNSNPDHVLPFSRNLIDTVKQITSKVKAHEDMSRIESLIDFKKEMSIKNDLSEFIKQKSFQSKNDSISIHLPLDQISELKESYLFGSNDMSFSPLNTVTGITPVSRNRHQAAEFVNYLENNSLDYSTLDVEHVEYDRDVSPSGSRAAILPKSQFAPHQL